MRSRFLCLEFGARRQRGLFRQQRFRRSDRVARFHRRRGLGRAHRLFRLFGARGEIVAIESLLLGDDLEFLGHTVEFIGIEAMAAAAPDRMDRMAGSTDGTIFGENAHCVRRDFPCRKVL